jgi:hypothetical protein
VQLPTSLKLVPLFTPSQSGFFSELAHPSAYIFGLAVAAIVVVPALSSYNIGPFLHANATGSGTTPCSRVTAAHSFPMVVTPLGTSLLPTASPSSYGAPSSLHYVDLILVGTDSHIHAAPLAGPCPCSPLVRLSWQRHLHVSHTLGASFILLDIPYTYLPALGNPALAPRSLLAGGWEQAFLDTLFGSMPLSPAPTSPDWVVDSGASTHITPTATTLSHSHPPSLPSIVYHFGEWFHRLGHLSR